MLQGELVDWFGYNITLQGLKHDSNDVKQMIGQLIAYITRDKSTTLDVSVCKIMVPALVMGTKEKNTLVKTNAELALIYLLQLRKGESRFKVGFLCSDYSALNIEEKKHFHLQVQKFTNTRIKMNGFFF